MKILLLNSPGGSHYDGPLMGIPSLLGQLKRRGYSSAFQRDLDLELFYHALKPETLGKVIHTLRRDPSPPHPPIGFVKRLFVSLLGPTALRWLGAVGLRDKKYLEAFRSATPIDKQFPTQGLLRYKKGVNRVLKLMAVYFYPHLSYPRFFSRLEKKIFNGFHLRIANTLAQYCEHGRKGLVGFYETELIPLLREGKFDVIGISVSFKRQLEPALILSETIKRHGIQAKIILGGSFVTTTLDSEWFEEGLMQHVDFVIQCEGEEALPDLLDHLKKKQSLENVPNLIYRQESALKENKRASIMDMDSLETPDYEGLSLDHYLERPVRLPLMTCRGCYWGKCTYCSHHWTLGSGRLRARSPEKLFEDLKNLKKKYGVRGIYFTDESIHPPTMLALAQKVIESRFDLRWVGMLRFDDCVDYEFLKTMKASGCHAIMFGLESVSEKVQKIINKGIELERARRILIYCKDLGIKVHLFIILGIPGEGEEDLKANYDFLLKETDLYETVQLAPFQLMKGSPMYRQPAKFGIHDIKIQAHPERRAYNQVLFETHMGLSRSQLDGYVFMITNNKILFKKDLWEGYGFRLYVEDEV